MGFRRRLAECRLGRPSQCQLLAHVGRWLSARRPREPKCRELHQVSKTPTLAGHLGKVRTSRTGHTTVMGQSRRQTSPGYLGTTPALSADASIQPTEGLEKRYGLIEVGARRSSAAKQPERDCGCAAEPTPPARRPWWVRSARWRWPEANRPALGKPCAGHEVPAPSHLATRRHTAA